MTTAPYSPKKLAERWCCSRQYVHKLIRDGSLPHFKLGGKLLRIPAEAVGDMTREQFKARLPTPSKPRPSRNLAAQARKQMHPPAIDSGYVYFIRCHRYVKIGYAASVPSRRRDLQIGNPYKLEIIGAFKAHPTAENDLHYLLARHRGIGEWFKLTPAMTRMIQELCDG